ncbi:MAG: hypothetical protein ACMG6H_05860 [Acidobacteriota bacterium]
MNSLILSLAQQKELVATWRETGRRLEVQRRAELASQTPVESRQAAFDMLQLGGMLPGDAKREESSGLVEMQRLFARWHTRGRL